MPVEAIISRGVMERAPVAGVRYSAFVDLNRDPELWTFHDYAVR